MSLTDDEGVWLASEGAGCADRPAAELGEGVALSNPYWTSAGPGWTVELRIGTRVPSCCCMYYIIKKAVRRNEERKLSGWVIN
jgi:hypothetical protein